MSVSASDTWATIGRAHINRITRLRTVRAEAAKHSCLGTPSEENPDGGLADVGDDIGYPFAPKQIREQLFNLRLEGLEIENALYRKAAAMAEEEAA
jgi:hypothetical protein